MGSFKDEKKNLCSCLLIFVVSIQFANVLPDMLGKRSDYLFSRLIYANEPIWSYAYTDVWVLIAQSHMQEDGSAHSKDRSRISQILVTLGIQYSLLPSGVWSSIQASPSLMRSSYKQDIEAGDS